MATDIPPLTPVTPTPLVREKRHYPGEEKDQPQPQNKKQKQQNEQNSEKDDALVKEADKSVDINEKDGTVRHIDEYA